MKTLLILGVLWLACTPSPVVPVPPDADASNCPKELVIKLECGAPTPPPPATCSGCTMGAGCACCVLRLYSCPEGTDTPKGERCEGVYADREHFQGLAGITAKEESCVSSAATIAAIRKCGVKCSR